MRPAVTAMAQAKKGTTFFRTKYAYNITINKKAIITSEYEYMFLEQINPMQ